MMECEAKFSKIRFLESDEFLVAASDKPPRGMVRLVFSNDAKNIELAVDFPKGLALAVRDEIGRAMSPSEPS